MSKIDTGRFLLRVKLMQLISLSDVWLPVRLSYRFLLTWRFGLNILLPTRRKVDGLDEAASCLDVGDFNN